MRNVVVFLIIPVLVISFFVYMGFENYQNQQYNKALVRGLEKYKLHQQGWPQDFSSIEPYLDQPDALKSMDPTFLPISNNEAYMEENMWSTVSTKRASFLIIEGRDGTCSIQTSQRL